MRVDLPAPLSPRRQWTSPGHTVEGDIPEGHDLAEIAVDGAQFDQGRLHQRLSVTRLST